MFNAFEAFLKANPNGTFAEFLDSGFANSISYWGIEIQQSNSDVRWFGDVYGDVVFGSSSNDSNVAVSGYIKGDVTLQPLADENSLSTTGVFGSVGIDDAWETTLVISGFVGGGIFVNDVRGGDYSIGWTPAYLVEDSTGVEVNIGTVGNVALDDVNQSETTIGTLTEYMTISGNGNDVSIGNATGATVQVASDAADTSLQIGRGGTVFDSGDSTSFVGGEGDQTVFANGGGISMYNGGNNGLLGEILGIPDDDRIVEQGGGVDIIAGFESAGFDTQGDVFVFDPQNLEEATLQLGNHDVDIDVLMAVFGQQDGNDAVLDFNGGSVTLVGAATDYFAPQVPVDDFLFA